MASCHHKQGRPAFYLALDGWPKKEKHWVEKDPRHLRLCFIIAQESGMEPYFLYSLLFKIWSVSRITRTIRRQFLWKTFSKSSSAFRSVHVSEPYLTTIITTASNILILEIQYCTFQYSIVLHFDLGCLKHQHNLGPDKVHQNDRYKGG